MLSKKFMEGYKFSYSFKNVKFRVIPWQFLTSIYGSEFVQGLKIGLKHLGGI